LALALGILTLTHQVTLWHVMVFAALRGLCNCFTQSVEVGVHLGDGRPGELRNAGQPELGADQLRPGGGPGGGRCGDRGRRHGCVSW